MRHTACLLALAALGLSAHAQSGKTSDPPPKAVTSEKAQRFVYLVRYGDAKQLAAALTQHFKDEPGMQIIPETAGNALLVTAPPAAAAELTKALDQLDRRPRQVLVEVLVAEVPLQEKENGFDPADFAGPGDKVLNRVEDLARKAKLNHLRRFQVAALENQQGSAQVADMKPVVTGVMEGRFGGGFGGKGGGGGAAAPTINQITYQSVGSLLKVTPRVTPDGTITLDLQLEETRLVTPENGVPLGNGVTASETLKTTFNGKVSVASGQTALAEGVKTEAKGLKVQSIVVVTAKVVEK